METSRLIGAIHMKQEQSTSHHKSAEGARDYLFDNMRAILIILVVWGHMLTSMIFDYDGIKIIYYILFFFHMPAMAFISGYFSKNTGKVRSQAFETILVPYLILNVFNYLFKVLIMKERFSGFRFFQPYWGLWYLLALFLWKFFLKDLLKIRFILPLSILFGILSGFSKEFSSYMALGRVFCFLPFFLLGYYCTGVHIQKLRRIPKLISLTVVAATAGLSALLVKNGLFEVEDLYLRKPYPEDADIQHMLYRILIYAVAISMTAALVILTGEKKCFLTKIGTGTMTLYVLHLFTVPLLEKLEILSDRPYLYILYSMIATALITFAYSRPIVIRIYDAIIGRLANLLLRNK